MAKRNLEADCDVPPAAEASCKTVFIDTNLDTHLALIVSEADNVLDLKNKIVSEHPQCFPHCGMIKISALKVKRKGHFYHLSDSMLVINAFEGTKKSWFLSVDASSMKQHNDNDHHMLQANNQLAVACIAKTCSGDGSSRAANNASNRIIHEDYLSNKRDLPSEGNIVSETNADQKGGIFQVVVDDNRCNNLAEGSVGSGTGVDKKGKSKKKTEDSMLNCTMGDENVDIDEHSSGKMAREAPNDVEMENIDDTNLRSNTGEFTRTHVETTRKDESSKMALDNQQNRLLKEASELVPASDKRKSRESKSAGNPQEDNNMGTALLNPLICESSNFQKQENKIISTDKLVTETPKDVPAVAGASSRKKKKRKNRSLNDEEVIVGTPCSHGVGEERCKESFEIVARSSGKGCAGTSDIEKASHAAIVSGVSQRQRHAEAVQVFQKEKQPLPSLGVDVMDHGRPIAEVKSAAHKLGHESGLRRTKKSKKPHSADVKELSSPVFADSSHLREDGIRLEAEDIIPDDDNFKTSGPGTKLVVSEKYEQLTPGGVAGHSKEATNDLGPKSGVTGTKKSKKHHSTNVKELPTPAPTEFCNLKEGKFVVSDNYKVKTGGSDKAEEQKGLPSEKCEQVVEGGADDQSKEAVVSANLLKTSVTMESRKTCGGERLKSRAKKPVSAKAVLSSAEYSDNSASALSAGAHRDCFSVEGEKEGDTLSQTYGMRSAEPNSLGTSSFGGNEGGGRLSLGGEELLTSSQVYTSEDKENNIDTLRQDIIRMTPKNTEISDAKRRKKTKKNQNSSGNTPLAVPSGEQEFGAAEENVSPNNGHDKVKDTSKTERKRKRKPVKTISENQLIGKELDPEKIICRKDSLQTLAVDSNEDPSLVKNKGSSAVKPLENSVNGTVLDNGNVIDATHPTEGSRSTGETINFKDYFVPKESCREAPPVDLVAVSVPELKSQDMAVKAKTNAKVSVNPKMSTVAKNRDLTRSGSSSKKEIGGKSSLGNHRVTLSGSPSKRIGEVVNHGQRENSLLATPGSIFHDYSSDSSEDRKGTVNSDASTETPLNNSSSSDDSDGESKASLDSARKGADGTKGVNDRRRNTETKTPHSMKNITMDMIFRSSSRFKKAKLSAAHSQLEDTESQPVDFVPDSQPNQ